MRPDLPALLLAALILALGSSCTGRGGEDSAEPATASLPVLAADLSGGALTWTDLEAPGHGTVLSLGVLDPACDDPDPAVYCLAYQARQRLALDGSSEAILTWSPLDRSDGDTPGRTDLLGEILAIGVEPTGGPGSSPPQERWRLSQLDLSLVGGACEALAADPCQADPEASTDAAFQACHLYQPHDHVVSAESEGRRSLWVADTRNARLIEVEVEDGDPCGTVTTRLGTDHPDWDIYLSPNSLELGTAEEGRGPGGLQADTWALLTIKDSFERSEAGEAQDGGDGRGKVVLFAEEAGTWRQVWEFPPEGLGAPSFLNSPHGAAWVPRAEGPDLVLFAHSLGRSTTDFNEGEDGSIGVLLVDGDTVSYGFDAVLDGAALRYPRDVRPLEDGSLLVVDSGCKGGVGCEHGTALWRVALPEDIEASGLGGTWDPAGGDQQTLELEVLGGPWLTGAQSLFSVETL